MQMLRPVFAIVASAGIAASFASPSNAADPTTADCLSANDKSISLHRDHKFRDARVQLLVCAAPSCPADIRRECLRRVDEINLAMPTIVFEPKDPSGNELSAVKVTMDGEVIAEKLEGTAISLDPGSRSFTFESPGQTAVTKRLVIHEGEKERRETVRFEATPVATAPAPAPSSPLPPPAVSSASAPTDQPGTGPGAQKIVGVAMAGVGVVGVALGAVFGFESIAKHNEAEKSCPGACPTQDGVTQWSDARSAGNISTVAFIAGGVALAGGTVLWLTAKSATPRPAPEVGLGPGSVLVRWAW
jgi:hypothetical protein